MEKGNYRTIKNFTFILLLLSFFITVNVGLAESAAPPNLKDAFDTRDNLPLDSAANKGAGFDTKVDINIIIGSIITSVLSLMGVIFLIMAIYAGYIWMMARGNEEMVEKAKNTLTNAIIGIVIVMAAYAISYFVLSQISTKTLNSGSGGSASNNVNQSSNDPCENISIQEANCDNSCPTSPGGSPDYACIANCANMYDYQACVTATK